MMKLGKMGLKQLIFGAAAITTVGAVGIVGAKAAVEHWVGHNDVTQITSDVDKLGTIVSQKKQVLADKQAKLDDVQT